jgi:glucokinase
MSPSQQLIARSEAKPPFFVGIDLGGTTVKISVVDDQGRALSWETIDTEVQRGPEDTAERVGQTVRRRIDALGLELDEVVRVGLGSPGTLDFHAGTMITPTNFPGWDGFPIRDRIGAHCERPMSFANDASAAAYGEFWVGTGQEYHSLILLTLGTGVGCGIIIGDLIIEGENGHGTECGHVIIDSSETARVCSCGQRGHLEAYASANGLIARTRDALATGRTSSLTQRIDQGEKVTPLMVAEEAEKGDKLSLRIVMETAEYLALGIASLVHTIDPTGVLIGGAMTFGMKNTDLGRCFLNHLREEFRRRTFPMLREKTRIDYATLGKDAGVIGAAGIARVDYFNLMRHQGMHPDAAVTPTASIRSVR